MPAPLAGIRVIEMGQLIAGPFAGQLLGAFGAEVIKIESPEGGDPLRRWRMLDEEGTSYWWRSIARNKQSVTLDLSKEPAREIARHLIEKSDVLIENFRPGRMEAWGLGPDVFRESSPDLIYTRVSGYGQDGPYAAKPGFASACEAAAGLRYLNGHPGEAPVRLNLSLGDTLAGMHAAFGAVLALLARERHGGGQSIDVSILESVFHVMEGVLPEYDGAGVVREPSGTTVTGIVPTNTYRCKDGRFIVIGGNGDSIFKRLMSLIGRPDLANDPGCADNAGRVRNEAKIDTALAAWCRGLGSSDALESLDAASVPAGPVNSIADIAADEHFRARGVFEKTRVNGAQRVLPGVHPKLDATPARLRWPGPELGEHTDAVLRRVLGTDDETLAHWREHGVI
ncbi:MAG: carnitine dehydratase [Gammaproteobacteria bacterium]|nr:MAG: carnitine dehydratase [Gammaproteobacteria bacterium]